MGNRLVARALPICFALLAALSIASLARAQADSCAGSSLTGSDTVPYMGTVSGGGDDIDLTACGATFLAGNRDTVTCFVPTNNCIVALTCSRPASAVVMNINVTTGASCSATPGCGSTATSGLDGVATLSSVSLTAGVEVCIYCDSGPANYTTEITLVPGTGDCGPLPVELSSFSVESSDESEEGDPEE